MIYYLCLIFYIFTKGNASNEIDALFTDTMYRETITKVTKFGGSSLASAEQFKKVYDIITSDKTRRFVIPSAPGKRFSGDDKVTDLLLATHKAKKEGLDYSETLNKIKERYNGIANELNIENVLDKEFETIEKALNDGCSADYMASRGEYLNGKLLAKYLGFDFVDAEEIIFFKGDGTFDAETTNAVASARLAKREFAVIPGFYGILPNGEIKTFSRGGSDITGAIIARAASADLYENWTDVSGFKMCDPRIVPDAKSISTITYNELRELAYMGATVLHEESVFPVRQAKIPINIKNTNAPEDPGTMIVPSLRTAASDDVITGVAGKKGFSIIHIEKDMMNSEIGFGMRVLQVLNSMNISFEHLPSGIDTMSVVLSDEFVKQREHELLKRLSDAVSPDLIDIQTGIALIAVVGRGMISATGTASRIFAAAAREGINIKMIDQGSSELNIILGIDENDFEKAIKTIYEEFVS